MEKTKCTVEDIQKQIRWSCIFEFHLNSDTPRLTECVTSVAFGKENKLYISFIDAEVFGDNYDLLNDLTSENISTGIDIALGDRNGDILTRCEFENCILKDVATVMLDYCDNYKTPAKRYIATVEYSNIYMIK